MPAPRAQPKEEEGLAGHELLRYLKARIEDFEQERAAMLESVDRCGTTASELYRLDWENRQRTDEIRELQKALSDAHNFLFEERQRLLALQAENDALRLQEIQDRKHIQQLLLLENPGSRHAQHAQDPRLAPTQDHLLLRIESLQAQLNEQRQLASERVDAFTSDRLIREAEEANHRSHMAQQLELAAGRLRRAEETLRQVTKDFILARRDKQSAEQHSQEVQSSIAEERSSAAEKLAQVRRKASEEWQMTKMQADSKLEDISGNLRKQLKAKEEELSALSSAHASSSTQYERRVVELEAKTGRLSEANRVLELRRHMDMEGFDSDVSNLRRQLTSVERKLNEMRLVERIRDDDRLDTLLSHLRKKTPSSPSPAKEGSDGEGGSVKGQLAVGLRDVRSRVAGLEDRLSARKKAAAVEAKR
ncbi:MAG: hypothetical protein WDW36_004665 [Sanguina aurantia]